ncbi:MAG: SDR family NAD(P)-dependent oxidoreductase [Candidatus Alcyoniella australis]|nr:SDR family NAD(P)-dependent oxidoreductase [Candidatus Alcyoniella australis]
MRVLITGGAGFVGCNAANRMMADGHQVALLDNLSRRGSRSNLEWLKGRGDFEFFECDVRDADAVNAALSEFKPQAMIHLAAQVAVTTSVENPREDFEINAQGTLNVLEAARALDELPFVVFASTNKVYGKMEDLKIRQDGRRYAYQDLPHGVDAQRPLDFYSPYGCSKGAADQYVRDYQRIYGLPSCVFRMSCIYGTRQFGVEDQGWVAWFVIAAVLGKQLTIYGDGMQVRDVLFVEDLVDAYARAIAQPQVSAGNIFNIGGGPQRQLSLLELIEMLERRLDRKIEPAFADWRPGDQLIYVSDIRRVEDELGWKQKVDVEQGVERLIDWVSQNKGLFQ